MVRASRTPTFKQAALMRAWKAAEAAGKDVVETRIGSDGSLALVHKAEARAPDPTTPYDQWKMSNGSS